MQSLLKTAEVKVDGIGPIKIRELSAKAFFEVRAKSGNEGPMLSAESLALVCKYGVIDWDSEEADSIASALPLRLLNEIALKIYELSGVDVAKNSEPIQSAALSSDSP